MNLKNIYLKIACLLILAKTYFYFFSSIWFSKNKQVKSFLFIFVWKGKNLFFIAQTFLSEQPSEKYLWKQSSKVVIGKKQTIFDWAKGKLLSRKILESLLFLETEIQQTFLSNTSLCTFSELRKQNKFFENGKVLTFSKQTRILKKEHTWFLRVHHKKRKKKVWVFQKTILDVVYV